MPPEKPGSLPQCITNKHYKQSGWGQWEQAPCWTSQGCGKQQISVGQAMNPRRHLNEVGIELNAINIVTRTSCQDAFHDHWNLWLLISYEPVSGNVLA